MSKPKSRKRFTRHFHTVTDTIASTWPMARLVAPIMLRRAIVGDRSYGASIKTMRRFFGDKLTITVDPSKIVHLAAFGDTPPAKAGLGPQYLISDGAWDLNRKVLRASFHIDETLELFEANLNYTQTAAFRRRIETCRSDNPKRHRATPIDTEEKIHDYYRRQIKLIDSIRRHGYLRRSSVLAKQLYDSAQAAREKREYEIGCAVARDGELLMFRTGRHRLGIALGLGLREVPVDIHHIHKIWVTNMMDRHQTNPADAIATGLIKITTRYGNTDGNH